MLHYLVKEANDPGMAYVASWGPAPRSRMRFLLYDELPQHRGLPAGTYIFSDLERLTNVELGLAIEAWMQLSRANAPVCLLNDPSRVPGRYELLRILHEKGENSYRVSRLGKSVRSLRFPVFLKCTNEHGHALPALLGSAAEVAAAVKYLRWRGHRVEDLFVVEFCDTSDVSGVFRKYSAFIVGDRILPRHLIFSRRWNVKKPDLVNADFTFEQARYLEENPHESWLRHIFSVAGIQYGRIDYSFLGGVPQVWEINTNPTVHKITPRLTSAFEVIDLVADGGETIPMSWDAGLVRSFTRQKRRDRRKVALWKVTEGLLSTRTGKRLIRLARTARPNRWYNELGR